MNKVLLLLTVGALTLTSCSKDDDSTPVQEACGCEVTVKGDGGTQMIDLSNSQTGVIGCGTRADQAVFENELILESLVYDYGYSYADAALIINSVSFSYRNFYCN